jgi:drug/metabolite transporter (DMT)-like permease
VGWIGLGLVAFYTGLISGADGITKLIASAYAAPQLFAISGLLVAAISAVCAGASRGRALATQAPRAMAARAVLTVLATVAFFQAFRLLPFADVFVFIGMMPIFAGLMSGPVLGEPVRPAAWLALAAGFVGVLCLLPSGPAAAGAGHLWAFAGAVTGTASMVLARLIASPRPCSAFKTRNSPIRLPYSR